MESSTQMSINNVSLNCHVLVEDEIVTYTTAMEDDNDWDSEIIPGETIETWVKVWSTGFCYFDRRVTYWSK